MRLSGLYRWQAMRGGGNVQETGTNIATKYSGLYLPVKKNSERSVYIMKKVVITIVMFAIAIGLILGVIVPIASHGKSTGQKAKTSMTTIDSDVSTLAQPIN